MCEIKRRERGCGGITLMVDVTRMPENSFGYVPTPALVAPIEFTLPKEEYTAIGGYADHMVNLADALADRDVRSERWTGANPWPFESHQSAADA